jgi:xanthine dehydrogenase accessory factor
MDSMRDILADIDRWRGEKRSIALATVVQTWGSSPRRAGSKMALTSDGKIAGSVSGGCVENAVVEAGVESLKTIRPRLLHFGVADETAWDVGLACGGSIDVFVKPLDGTFLEELRPALTGDLQALALTVIRGPDELLGREMLIREDGQVRGTFGNDYDQKVLELAKETLLLGTSRRLVLDESIEIFAEFLSPPPSLVAVGGVQIAQALLSLAKILGYRTVLIDPRKSWGNEERFPDVDLLIRSWPDEAFHQINLTPTTAIAVLTHDPKLDDSALRIALPSRAFYVGALGSQSTQAKRRARLSKDGLTESELARLHGPIGLDIGGESPEEIALAIMAQVVSAYHRRDQPEPEREANLHSAA